MSVLVLLALAVGASAQEEKPAAAGGDCRTCHEEKLVQWDKTYHAGVPDGCAACHKGAEAHLKGRMEGENTPGPSLKSLPAKEVNAVCLSCHETTHHSAWTGSAHSRRGLACTQCHSVHSFESRTAQLKTAKPSDVCMSCHTVIRAQMMRTSHHPVREGLMECTSCHNPHGSNHDKMLVARLPWLCQRCHLNTRHPGTFYDGRVGGGSLALSTNRAVEHACKNCHQNIHGGNAPSGPYFGR